ncbi:MAG: DUF4465 domain-containing protein [Marinilabiliaceae bacterium]|nr:DUF4465 domain-containing protein [Marinilabiliaceae bacterium]
MKHFLLFTFLLVYASAYSQQLNESFEGATFPPDGWTATTSDASDDGWRQNNGTSHGPNTVADGTFAACVDIYHLSKNETATLTTPVLDLSTLTAPKLSFKWQCKNGSDPNPNFQVELSTDNGSTYSEIYNQTANGSYDDWTAVVLDLPETSNQTIIRFIGVSDYGSYNLFLDKVKVYEPQPMEVSSVLTAQPNTEVASIGASNVEILQINVKTTGTLTQESATQFTFSTNGTTDAGDIEKASLYYGASSPDFSNATLFGEINTLNGEFTITGNQELSEGDNYFWLAYDISSSAAANNVIDAECSSVTVASADHSPVLTAPDGNRLLSKLLNMQTGTNSYSVNGSLAFYDDGGKDASYTEGFEGTIIFTPATQNKKIKIEWNNFQIFNTGSIDKNDVFKIYNGTTVDEANLVGQYSNVPPPITSMSADGSLTIYFKVKTGVPKAGWDALVKEITPQNMVFDAVQMYQMNAGNVAAADEDQEIALIEVSTQNTENPLRAENFSLSLNGTTATADISKAKIYYTGGTLEFSTDHLFGAIEHPSVEYSITGTGSQDLVEGSNYFWLVYDVSNTATNGNVLDAEVKAITTSGSSHNLATTSADGSRTVDNTYFMPTSGTQSKTIYAPVSFVDDGGLTGNYGASTMSTVTFVPAVNGEVVKLDFEAFDVLYQASSFGTKAFFAIYNGNGTASNNIIWKADETNCTQGPSGIITSTAADGALTIKFVGNALYSSQTKAGWKAQVWSAVPSDMEYQSAEATQSTQIVKAGSTNQEILHIQLQVSGTQNPISELGLTFNTQGSSNTADISAARLYSTGISSTFTMDTQSGDEVATPNGAFTISHTGELQEGVNHFWLVYDIASSATVENVVDASLDKITVGTTEYAVTDGNPEGNRIIKRLYELETGTHEIVVNENPLAFYDDGGISANYSKEFDGTVTFTPGSPDQKVRLEFSRLGLSSMEDLYVYNGGEVTDANLLLETDDDHNRESTDESLVFKSTSAGGKLTVRFTSTRWSTPLFGWEASVFAFTPQPYSYQGAAAEQGISTVLRSESNANILHIPVEFSGELTPATVNSFTFNTTGSSNVADIASAQVFYTAKDAVFNPMVANKFGNVTLTPSGSFTITGSQEVAIEGAVHFWLMYTVSTDASVNNVLDAQLTAIEVNNIEHTITNGNPDGHATIQAGLSGSFTIGADADDDYANFTDAFADIALKGIEGPVTITVDNGTYTERPRLPHIKGASAQNTITIQSQSGVAENVVLVNHKSAVTSNSAPDDAVLYIEGADFVIFRHMTFKTSQQKYDALVMVINQSRDVTFDGCIFEAPIANGNIDIAGLQNKANNEANQNNDRLTVMNSRFIGGKIGAYLGGTGHFVLPKETGVKVINNTFEQQYSKGIYLNNAKDVTVSGNKIFNNTTTKTGFQGIDAYQVTGKSNINNNYIHLDLTKYCTGIECRPIKGTAEQPAMVYNNVVVLTQSVGSSYGLLLNYGCSNTNIYHNTIVLKGDSETTSALFVAGGSKYPVEAVNVKNNLIINQANGKAVKVNNETFLTGLTFDHNNLYTSGTYLAQVASENVQDLAGWQVKVTAANSLSEAVTFYSATDMHLKEAGNLNAGIPITTVTTDMDGQTRSTSTPTIGADEFTQPDLTAPVLNEGYPKVDGITYNSATLKLSLNEAGNAWWVILPNGSAAPSHQQIKAGTDATDIALAEHLKGNLTFSADVEAQTGIASLNSNAGYIVYISVEDNLSNAMSDVASVSFKTDFKPTEVATFEAVQSMGGPIFSDGTATFMNVTVSDGEGIKGSSRFGLIAANKQATISLTNTIEGLPLEGFFYQSATDIRVKGGQNDGSYTAELTITACESWNYADLSSLGNVTSIYITAGTSDVQIDNFADVPLKMSLVVDDQTIARGASATLIPVVAGGVKPYSYNWTSVVGFSEPTLSEQTVSPESTNDYHIQVTDARGTSVSTDFLVNVNGNKALAATFEGLLSTPQTYYIGNPDQMQSFFYSGSFKFSNFYAPSLSYWSRFAYSNETSTVFDPANYLTTQFRSAAGKGAKNTETYGVVYAFGDAPEVSLSNTTQGEVLIGCYLTNNCWAVHSMENGDATAGEPFTQNDWYKVSISGYDKDGSLTGTKDVYLADYRSANPDDHYIQKEWKWVDLSELGAVQKLIFHVDGSRTGDQGLNSPGYFCIDELNGTKEVSTDIHPVTEASVSLYPNPTNGPLTIDLSGLMDAQLIEVFSTNGKLIMQQTVTHQLEELDLSSQPTGLYLVRIITANQTILRKVYLR